MRRRNDTVSVRAAPMHDHRRSFLRGSQRYRWTMVTAAQAHRGGTDPVGPAQVTTVRGSA